LSIAFGDQKKLFYKKPERPVRFFLDFFKKFSAQFCFSDLMKSCRKNSIFPGFAFSIGESGLIHNKSLRTAESESFAKQDSRNEKL
jgi:hypothetical protein